MSAEDPVSSHAVAGQLRDPLGTILRRNAVLVALALVFVALLAFVRDFGSVSNLMGVLRQSCIVGAMSLGMTVAFLAGEFDMSPAATASCAGTFAAALMGTGVSALTAISVAFAFGVVAGVVNGFLVVALGVNSFIATLGTHFVINGIELLCNQGNPLFRGIPIAFLQMARGYVGPIPVPVILVVSLGALLWAAFKWTLGGRYTMATGGNPVAARLSGVNVAFYRWLSFVVSSVFGVIGGLLMVARVGSAQVLAGEPILLDVFIAVLLGMAVFNKETPTFFSSLAGAVVMAVLTNSLALLGVSAYFMSICKGIMVLTVLTTSKFLVAR